MASLRVHAGLQPYGQIGGHGGTERGNTDGAEVVLPNNRRIQNHIGGLHACSMALAAESATGMVVGMNVPDTHLPLSTFGTVRVFVFLHYVGFAGSLFFLLSLARS